MVELEDLGFTSHRYIKNTSASGKILTEQLLNASRGALITSKYKRFLCNQVRKMRERDRKEKRKGDGILTLEGGG